MSVNPDPDLFMIMMSVVSIAIGLPIAVGISKRLTRGPAPTPTAVQLPADVEQRLQRIEHAVDSIAVEMERVSEGQRFTTRLLAERNGAAGGPSGPGDAGARGPGAAFGAR